MFRPLALVGALALGLAQVAQAQLTTPPAARPPGAFNLGPLGARAKLITVDGAPALELIEVDRRGALDEAKLEAGEVIIGVGRKVFPKDKDPIYLIGEQVVRLLAARGDQQLLVQLKSPSKRPRYAQLPIEGLGSGWEAELREDSYKALFKLMASSKDKEDDPRVVVGSFKTEFNSIESKVAVSALAGLAIFAGGGGPRGDWSSPLRTIKGFLNNNATRDSFGEKGGSPNRSQVNWPLGFAAMTLAEYIAHKPDRTAKKRLERICAMLAANQETTGGWAHGPGGPNSLGYTDLVACTVVCLAGMSAAKRAGVKVDENAISKAVEYVKRSAGSEGQIGYSPRGGQVGMPEPGRAAAALVAFAALKQLRKPLPTKTRGWLKNNLTGLCEGHASPMYHMAFGGWGAQLAGAGKAYRKLFHLEVIMARKPDGLFYPRPSKEQVKVDTMMGSGWATSAYLIAWNMCEANRFRSFR